MTESDWVAGLLASSRNMDDRAVLAIESLNEDQLNWRPDKETWSVLQQFQHLVLANSPYLPIVEDLASRAGSHSMDYRPGFWGKFLVYAVGPEEKVPSPVPKPLIPSNDRLNAATIEEYRALQDRFHQVLESLKGKDLNGKFTSPFAKFVKLKLGDAIHITERHNARHLGKAIRLIDRTDFPR